MTYRHAQTGWPMRISFAAGAIVLVVVPVVQLPDAPIPRAVLVVGALLLIALGFAMSRLTIEIDNERAHWWFGLGWPRGSVLLTDIHSVETTRTNFWQGWGVHYTRNGWLYNVAGYDAVRITRHDKGRVMLGTDEPRRLKAAFDRAIVRPPHDRMRA